VSVVDALLVAGTGDDHLAPLRSRRHALVALLYVSALMVLAYSDWRRLLFRGDFYAAFLPGFFWFVALVFYVIRQGRLRVDGGAVRWGWNLVSFRMPAERMARIRLYKDGASLVSQRRGAWHLLARDWERWSDVARALARLPVQIERPEASVPFMGRLQSYGRALDVMLVINSVAATLVFLGI
jgi:hypothetical protein